MPFADVVQWVAASLKTGTLVIDGSRYTKKVYFSRGSVVAVASDNPREMLGYYLVGWRYLTEELLQYLIEMQEHFNIMLGELAVKLGHMTRKELERVMRVKTEETVYDLLRWDEGNFRFLEGQLPERDFLQVDLTPSSFLLEGFRQRDERQRMIRVVPSTRHVPVPVADLGKAEGYEGAILEAIDGTRSIEDVALWCRVPVFTVMSVVFERFQKDLLRVDAPSDEKQRIPGQSEPIWQDLADEIEELLQRDRYLDALQTAEAMSTRFGDRPQAVERASEVRYQVEQALDKGPLKGDSTLEPAAQPEELIKLDCAPAEGFILSRVNSIYTVNEVLNQLPGSALQNKAILHNLWRRGLVKVRDATGVKLYRDDRRLT
jgi:hypothetical protein